MDPELERGSIQAGSVLILPQNFGSGLRWKDDKIWGIFPPSNDSLKIWDISQNLIDKYGLNLDIIFDDKQFNLENEYLKIYLWNQSQVTD